MIVNLKSWEDAPKVQQFVDDLNSKNTGQSKLPVCESCNKELTAAEVKWCKDRPEKYNNKILCKQCQKEEG